MESSLNFVTCHDGFTLNDLVSYDTKHNLANGEGDRDGSDLNFSWNSGVEGPTDDPAIQRLRERQIRNFLVVNLLAIGVPMILMGDEVRRTQGGNNNAYAHDDMTSWFDWAAVERRGGPASLHEGAASSCDDVCSTCFEGAEPELHGVRAGEPDLGPDSRSIAMTFRSADLAVHLICNACWESLEFQLPDPGRGPGVAALHRHDPRAARRPHAGPRRGTDGGWVVLDRRPVHRAARRRRLTLAPGGSLWRAGRAW